MESLKWTILWYCNSAVNTQRDQPSATKRLSNLQIMGHLIKDLGKLLKIYLKEKKTATPKGHLYLG